MLLLATRITFNEYEKKNYRIGIHLQKGKPFPPWVRIWKWSSDWTVVHPDDPRGIAKLRAVGGADGAAGESQLLAGDLRLRLVPLVVADPAPLAGVVHLHVSLQKVYTETANKDGRWLREISSCCCLTTADKTRQLLLNKIYVPFLPSL